MALAIKLDSFEGPLDLLLHLISKNKIDIYDIPIALITEQYLEYINELQSNNMEVMSEFLVMAATLLEIKAKMLLPVEKEKDEDEGDPRKELVERLLEYKMFKHMSKELKEYFIEEDRLHFRGQEKTNKLIEEILRPDVNDLLSKVTLSSLEETFVDIMKRWQKSNEKVTIDNDILMQDEIKIDDRMDFIMDELDEKETLCFNRLFNMTDSKMCIIVTFLSVLELIRMDRIIVNQIENGGDIFIKHKYKN